ncbi:MAG TPA: hypothetical protein PLG27_07725 [Candidatus Latescibacteria bacterium]|nr:hypothetical protein [Candidatus Latescibacterota bacterium]
MQGIMYLDALASFGKMGPKDEEVSWKLETLLDEMAWCGIHGALVYHNVAREYDPAYGNRMLMEFGIVERRVVLQGTEDLPGIFNQDPPDSRQFAHREGLVLVNGLYVRLGVPGCVQSDATDDQQCQGHECHQCNQARLDGKIAHTPP